MSLRMLARRVVNGACAAVGLALVFTAFPCVASATVAPEIDPGSVVSGASLLVGSLLLLKDRWRRK